MSESQSAMTFHHYEQWASTNANSWVLSDNYFDFWSEQINKHLDIQPQDRVCDLGAGTGRLAVAIREKSGAAFVCVEPSAPMVSIIRDLGLEAVHQSGDEFVHTAPDASFDKILIKQAIHHMTGRPRLDICRDFHRILKPKGMGLILTMPSTILYPMFKAARDRFEQHQIDIVGLIKDLEESGFKTFEEKEDFPVNISRDDFFKAIRARFISDLAAFSPEEIELGILEIRESYQDPLSYHFGDRLHLLKFCA